MSKRAAEATKATERAGVAVTWALSEILDALQRPQHLMQFFDADGDPVPSWCVPLGLYLEAYDGLNPYAERAHQLVVARAILHHLPVPLAVADSHDAMLMTETVLMLQRLHGPMPNKYCRLCSPAENIEEIQA